MDKLTQSRSFIGFARICIEMDLSKPLPDFTYVKLRNGQWAKIEVTYAWKPQVCTTCKIVGHNISSCPLETKPDVPPQRTFFKEKNGDGWKNQKTKKIWVKKDPSLANAMPFACVMTDKVNDQNNRFSVLDENNANEATKADNDNAKPVKQNEDGYAVKKDEEIQKAYPNVNGENFFPGYEPRPAMLLA